MRGLYIFLFLLPAQSCFCWGFYAHRKINHHAVFLLPPEMMVLYKPHIVFLSEHAVDPDKRRNAVREEAARHYIDIDRYDKSPFDSIPRRWEDAVARYSEDTLHKHGIVPWWIQVMLNRLTAAFREKNQTRILKLSAEIGHYISDAHVPLHASSNHNGQYTGQKGIHGFWESRIPELLAEKKWKFFSGRAVYLEDPLSFTWVRVLESAAAADTVLRMEKKLSQVFPPEYKYAFEERNGKVIRQYSSAYAIAYDKMLLGMIQRRMQQSIHAIASFWYTAWVNAGQPDLRRLLHRHFSEEDEKEFTRLNSKWQENKTSGCTDD